jgi:hypothetical protein
MVQPLWRIIMKSVKFASLMIAALTIAPQLSNADGFSSSAGNQMSYGDAEAYCKDHGGHLPSVREMAIYAMSQGAAGIKETSLSGRVSSDPSVKAEIIEMGAQGYRMVQKAALWAPAVDFYYSANGFQNSQGTDAKLWTSSTDSSSSSLIGGEISLVIGTEHKFTLSGVTGSLGEDPADTGRNAVICATETIGAPAPVNSGSDSTIATINPAQINFLAQGKTLYATILDSNSNAVETIALDTSNLGRDAKSIQAARDKCTDIAAQAASLGRKLKLDVSYKKVDQFCTISDDGV